MLSYGEYLIEDKSFSIFNIKVLKICGKTEFNEKEVIKKIRNVVREFLNKNKDVDYLITYYFSTYGDMENNAALCFLVFDEDIKNIDLSDKEIYRRLQWNEDYGFFSDVVKEKISSGDKLFNEANKMLHIVEDAYFILYDLWVAVNYRGLSGRDGFYECLEKWLIMAERIDKHYGKLKFIVNNNFISLIRHMNNILYYCCIPDDNKDTTGENKRQWIFNQEITNAKDKSEVIHQQLTNFIRKYPTKEEHKDNVLHLSKNKEGKKEVKEI